MDRPAVGQDAVVEGSEGSAVSRGDEIDAAHELGRVRAVLRGERVDEDPPALAKMVSILLAPGAGVDMEVSAAGFLVRHAGRSKATPHAPHLAPAHVQVLAWLGGVSAFSGAAVFRVDREASRRARGLVDHGPRWIWVREDADAVRIAVRHATAEGPPPGAPGDLPPPLPGPVRKLVALPEATRCPHCAAPGSTFRCLRDAVVCGACGGSFELPPEILARGSVREAG